MSICRRLRETVFRGAFLPTKTAIHSLHNKLFRNYKDWCESMRIAPCFMPYPPANDDIYGGRGGSDKLEVRFPAAYRKTAQQVIRGRENRPVFVFERARELTGWARLLLFFSWGVNITHGVALAPSPAPSSVRASHHHWAG